MQESRKKTTASDVAEPRQKVERAYSTTVFEAGWYALFLPKPFPI